MAGGQWTEALRIASRFQDKGAEKIAIERAWEATQRPAFCRQLGRDPAALIEEGKLALERRYGHGVRKNT